MRKFLTVLIAASLLLFMATPAFAQSRYGLFTTQSIETSKIAIDQDGDAMTDEVWVYELSIFCDTATAAVMGVYDVDTFAELVATGVHPRDEIGEPTQYENSYKTYDQPRHFTEGLGVVIRNGIAWVTYGPAP